MSPKEIGKLRESLGLTRAEFAKKLKVSYGAARNWEAGTAKPQGKNLKRLKSLAGKASEPQASANAPEYATYGAWIQAERAKQGLSRADLATKSGLSYASISNIETGGTSNPQRATKKKLESALGTGPPKSIADQLLKDSIIEGIGELSDFDPHVAAELPAIPGVYVLYDISDRAVYVGESGNIKRRMKAHVDKFWFKPPIVEYGSYVEVENNDLRRKLEQTLIKFMKSNAVINSQHVDR